MKKTTIIFTISLFVSAAMGFTAVSETYPTVSESDLEHRFDVEVTNINQGDQLDYVDEINIEHHEHTVEIKFNGAINGPNPCQIVEGDVNEVETGEVEIDVSTVSDPEAEMCATVMSSYGYSAEFEKAEVSSLTILHNGVEVESTGVLSETGETGFVQRLLSFFGF